MPWTECARLGLLVGVAGGAERLRAAGAHPLGVRLMAVEALDLLLGVLAGFPCAEGGLVAHPARFGIHGQRHRLSGRMPFLEGAVARLAGHALGHEFAAAGVEPRGMALQAVVLVVTLRQFCLKDGIERGLGMRRILPDIVLIRVAGLAKRLLLLEGQPVGQRPRG